MAAPAQLDLAPTSSPAQTLAWLRARGFQAFESVFASYSPSDILRLSRDDVIQICGLADGIRLYNALRPKARLSLFFTCSDEPNKALWRQVYLESLTSQALAGKVLAALALPNDRHYLLALLGPQDIHVLVTDDVVANMKDNSMFLAEVITGQ